MIKFIFFIVDSLKMQCYNIDEIQKHEISQNEKARVAALTFSCFLA